MKRYNPSNIEPKWQKIWEDKETFKAKDFDPKPKKYVAGQFPYPSAAGLHAGHAKVYAIVDAMARFYRQSGHNVLNPMGWDNFGMPTENYAIKTGKSPQEVTIENVTNFKRQFKRMGVSIDWSREILTSDPEYYRWTQWIFKKLYERGLVYRAENLQWWCPNDKTVLANEQVEDGLCWRCKCQVEKRRMNQWFFKITAYADQLLGDVDSLDWPSGVKEAQKNWIGRSEGAEVEFEVDLGESTPSGISESGSLREKRVRPVATGADDAVRLELSCLSCWRVGSVHLSGIIDFEKAALGHPTLDLARSFAFLLVDVPSKPPKKIFKYLIESGYNKRGQSQIDLDPKLFESLANFFLIHDFYKFLRHNPYESLASNHHYLKTRDILLASNMLQYNC
ncbi:class I tRNA ligase family protein [Candidatus Saccharibacteria bacterium]|nr:class I tRNA ligase family protein [Candidatus Saccharibacteria bacterium]